MGKEREMDTNVLKTFIAVRYFRRPVFLPGRTAGRAQLQKAH